MDNKQVTFPYRDRDLNKVQFTVSVSVNERATTVEGERPIITLLFQANGRESKFTYVLPEVRIEAKCDKANPPILDQVQSEMVRLAKWMILNGSYRAGLERKQNDRPIELTKWKDAAVNDGITYSLDDFSFRLRTPTFSHMIIAEHQVARDVVLDSLYKQSPQDRDILAMDSHFPSDFMQSEITGLSGSECVAMRGDSGAENPRHRSLTIKGREYYENRARRRSGRAFIIAACESTDGKRPGQKEVIAAYKEAVESFQLEPIFQEHEEPYKNIYVDIFDYIDSCEFVVADLTYERLNCYVEIGYALAKQKPILLFVQKGYAWREEKVPFDVSVIKWQEYDKGKLDGLKELCRKRIEIIRDSARVIV